MPELPEVEVVRRGLEPHLKGQMVHRVIVRESRMRWPVPASLPGLIEGRAVTALERRGKYLLARFNNGTLIVHLGMSGNLLFLPVSVPARPHDHIDIEFDQGVLRFNDPRRFGSVLWHDRRDGPVLEHPLLASLGVEPLEGRFDGAVLYAGSRGRRISVKQFLLAGLTVVGVGNIYASESLFRAGIRPGMSAGRLTRPRCEKLARAIRETLADAIDQGGTTLRDFAGSTGTGGYFQLSCQVYGREGLPCLVCDSTIRRTVQQGRATYWCPTCQS